MNSFWANLYDRHKDRRYAVVFLVTLLVLFGLVVPVILLFLNIRAYRPPLVDLLPGIGLFAVAIAAAIWRAVHRARTGRKPSRTSPLSRDEVRKARSKLMKERQRHERSMHFGSGGDCGVAGVQRGSGGGGNIARLPGRQRNG